jgi:hypothetical protein
MRFTKIAAHLCLCLCLISVVWPTKPWVAREDGVGPIKAGMTLSQLNAVLQERFSLPADKNDRGCFYVTPSKHPHLSLMIENGRLARIDVDSRGVATSEGIQVGDTEAQAMNVYGSRLKIEPHHYTEGHYLTVRSSEGRFGIRFETEQGKITTFYSGRYNAIQYVEGCQ